MDQRLQERDAILLKMGFASYQAYLESELWAAIRDKTLARFGHKCRFCKKPTCTVHHSAYTRKVLEGRKGAGLHLSAVCNGCHFKLHFDFDKRFLAMKESFKKFRKTKRTGRSRPEIGLAFKAAYLQQGGRAG